MRSLLITGWLRLTFSREIVSFDKAWRFHLGDPSEAMEVCPSSNFPQSLDGNVCPMDDMSFVPIHTSADDCRRACCSGLFRKEACATWLFSTVNDYKRNITRGCYIAPSMPAGCVPDAIHNSWFGGSTGGGAAPPPPNSYSFGEVDYDDSDWEIVDVPHDFVIGGVFTNDERLDQHGYLPKDQPGWYRKHFRVPTDWKGSAISLEFDGVFHVTRAWLNGCELTPNSVDGGHGNRNGYTGFVLQLEGSPRLRCLRFDSPNVLSIRADASFGSGHWYEGGGIYRNVRIVSASKVRFASNGLFAAAGIDLEAGKAKLHSGAMVVNDGPDDVSVSVSMELYKSSAEPPLARVTSSVKAVASQGHADISAPILNVANPSLWSIKDPTTYTLVAKVASQPAGEVLDVVNLTIGLRQANFTADAGFFLNGRHVVLRGFSDHNDFAGVGAAVPGRINLFRAQMLRAVGGNTWRMSHNPGDPFMFDLLDTLGILAWDENRDFTLAQVPDMVDMVVRDRNHPSIIAWSYCNEVECHENGLEPDQLVAMSMRRAALEVDSSRPFTANLNKQSSPAVIGALDLYGISHNSQPLNPTKDYVNMNYSFAYVHQTLPSMPIVSGEGSSCLTQRGVNKVDIESAEFELSFNGDCLSKRFCPTDSYKANGHRCQQSWTTGYTEDGKVLPFLAGTLGVWTLFDYIGEPTSYTRGSGPAWPQVSSSFGSFDLAGFAKAPAYHYRAWWLCNVGVDDDGRPPVAEDCSSEVAPVVRIVQDWRQEPTAPETMAVYSNAPKVEMHVNGRSLGMCEMKFADYCSWSIKEFEEGEVTVVAFDKSGKEVGSDTSKTPGAAHSVALSLDAPNERTGTGSSVMADGEDVALLRATIVDSQGTPASGASHRVSFRVISGPGKIVGVGNGDPSSHEPNVAANRSAYHGLARAIVRVTVNAVTLDRARQQEIDIDGGAVTEVRTTGIVEDIVVEATAPGLKLDRLTIPVSTDTAQDGVLAVARRSQNLNLDLDPSDAQRRMLGTKGALGGAEWV